ncbi:MAG: LysR family transcriptional regulator [Dehalococcoidia bacterium]|nr:MAG: LysR family transcriptional regulator [Dehalococcoidia bacterium]
MQPKINLWIEKDGQVVLSLWRVQLLEAVAETGSISAAAVKMNISYHRAWDKIHECEERLGVKLVETQTGGTGGGGTQLTPVAADYIQRFHQFAVGIESEVSQRFKEFFANG